MSSAKDDFYLIAAHVFDQTKSRILETVSQVPVDDWHSATSGSADVDLLDTLRSRLDLTEFLGGGYKIVFCRRIDLSEVECLEDEYDEVVALGPVESPEMFQVIETTEEFPLIEGSFVPGIYRVGQMGGALCAVNDPADLSNSYIRLDTGLAIDQYKLVCHPDKVRMQPVAEDAEVQEKLRHPFTFFDFYCPFCRRKVLGCWLRSVRWRDCDVIETPCPHFIGYLARIYGNYEKPALDDLRFGYKYEDGDLYFEAAPGRWQKPCVIVPPVDPINSYWNHHGDETVQDEMLFFESFHEFEDW